MLVKVVVQNRGAQGSLMRVIGVTMVGGLVRNSAVCQRNPVGQTLKWRKLNKALIENEISANLGCLGYERLRAPSTQ